MTLSKPPDYKHLPVGHPDNPKPYPICGAKTRNEEARGELCLQPAGKRTAHAGVGRCWLHGGRNLSGPEHGSWVDGRRAYRFRGRLAEHFRQVQEATIADPLDLLPELEVQRTLLSLAIDELQAGEPEPSPSPATPSPNEDTTKLASAIAIDDKTNAESIEPPVGGMGGQLIDIERIPSEHPPPAQFLITLEKVESIRTLANDVVKTVSQIILSRNQTAMTVAEIEFIREKMRQGIELFIVEPERRRAFWMWMREQVPGGSMLELEEGE